MSRIESRLKSIERVAGIPQSQRIVAILLWPPDNRDDIDLSGKTPINEFTRDGVHYRVYDFPIIGQNQTKPDEKQE